MARSFKAGQLCAPNYVILTPTSTSISPVGLRKHGHEEVQEEGKDALTRKLAEEAEVVLEALNLRLEDGNCNHIARRDLGGKVEREERNSIGRLLRQRAGYGGGE